MQIKRFGPSLIPHDRQVKKIIRFCEEVHRIHEGVLTFRAA